MAGERPNDGRRVPHDVRLYGVSGQFMPNLSIHLAQPEFRLGDLDFQVTHLVEVATAAAARGADLVVFPELWLPGYPAQDLLYRGDLMPRIQAAIDQIARELSGVTAVVLGYPRPAPAPATQDPDGYARPNLYNVIGLIADGEILSEHRKRALPNYEVFDERRYFQPGSDATVVNFKGHNVGLLVCEDIWVESVLTDTLDAGADLIIAANASPYHRGKWQQRADALSAMAKRHAVPVLYANAVGGQDDLIFDGDSQAYDAQGQCVARAALFETACLATVFDGTTLSSTDAVADAPDTWGEVYDALVVGTRDYINKNGFPGVILGLSGGIDSALTLAVAVDALGADRVGAIMMPFHYTSDISKHDAAEQAMTQGVDYQSLAIVDPVNAFLDTLKPALGDGPLGTTRENLQSRTRGVLLMAMSNFGGRLVLTTGNKSELAVGYATLYGDMAGGYNVLRDVPKTWVFELSKFRNTRGMVIPERVITRPPSAELAPDQVDTDSLPDYPVLDAILAAYLDEQKSQQQIIDAGFDEADVWRVVRLVNIAEYKRRQGAPGPRITPRSFNYDRRVPITQGWDRA